MCQLSIIVPAYNEAAIIAVTVSELDRYMQTEMSGWTYEILVVDDGSRDGMDDVLRGIDNPRLRVVAHPYNRGRGAGIRTGFEHARGEYLVCLDADLSYAPWHIEQLLAPLVAGEADITLASAYHPQGTVKNVPPFRAFMSRWGNRVLSSGVYGKFHTLTCMVRGYRRDVVRKLELVADNKDLHIEILQKANLFGFRIAEIPAELVWRSKDRARRLKSGRFASFPLFAMSGTIASHLVYNYVLRPGRTLLVPIFLLTLLLIGGALTLIMGWVIRFVYYQGDGSFPTRLYVSLRETLLQGTLTLTIMLACSAAILVFVSFYFVSQQSKKQFEEMYILLVRMNERLKKLENQITD